MILDYMQDEIVGKYFNLHQLFSVKIETILIPLHYGVASMSELWASCLMLV